MEAICQRYSYDFRDYSLPSQRRRVNQALERFHCPDLPALQATACWTTRSPLARYCRF